MDKVAEASGGPVICNKSMVREANSKSLMLAPRDKGLAFTTEFNNLHANEVSFKNQVEKPGVRCAILHIIDSIELK